MTELKEFKVHTILVLDLGKEIITKSSIQVLNYLLLVDETFKSMH